MTLVSKESSQGRKQQQLCANEDSYPSRMYTKNELEYKLPLLRAEPDALSLPSVAQAIALPF